MAPPLIALSIPAFLLFLVLELRALSSRSTRSHDFEDTLSNLACGITQQALSIFLRGGAAAAYGFLFSTLALIQPAPGSAWPWVLAFVGVDFAYYFWHRLSHRVNFLWAIHAVHHQSQEFNLGVALRQAWFSTLSFLPFLLPLSLLGVSPLQLGVATAFSSLYQFWIHTRLIGDLGPLEGVLNTPAAHRVHHGVNPEYIDKNFGATWMLWDRLWGTYQPEGREVAYGTVHPFRHHGAVQANLIPWIALLRNAYRWRKQAGFLGVLLAPPEWRPESDGGIEKIPEPLPESVRKWRPARPLLQSKLALTAQTLVASAGLMALLLFQENLGTLERVAAVTVLIVWCQSWFQRRRAHLGVAASDIEGVTQ